MFHEIHYNKLISLGCSLRGHRFFRDFYFSETLKIPKTRGIFQISNFYEGPAFVYIPKHCSWLNRIEIWFSILGRRLLERASGPLHLILKVVIFAAREIL